MENEINEMTMEFAKVFVCSEIKKCDVDRIPDRRLRPAVENALKIMYLDIAKSVNELYDAFEKWLAENPGDYPYVRLRDALLPPYICGLTGEARLKGGCSNNTLFHTGGNVSVTDKDVLKAVYTDFSRKVSYNYYAGLEYWDLCSRVQKRGGRGGDLAYRMHHGGLNKNETEELDLYLRKEKCLMLSDPADFEFSGGDFPWYTIWSAFNANAVRFGLASGPITAYEFLTRYCVVRPFKNKYWNE